MKLQRRMVVLMLSKLIECSQQFESLTGLSSHGSLSDEVFAATVVQRSLANRICLTLSRGISSGN